MSATHLSVDTVEDALLGAGFEPGWTTGVAAYQAVRFAAEQNLLLGHTVVVDAVNDTDAARQTWRDAATATRNELRFVLLRPPPPDEHQRRLRGRKRALLHVHEPTWEQVVERARMYEEWSDTTIPLSASEPAERILEQLERALERGA